MNTAPTAIDGVDLYRAGILTCINGPVLMPETAFYWKGRMVGRIRKVTVEMDTTTATASTHLTIVDPSFGDLPEQTIIELLQLHEDMRLSGIDIQYWTPY